MSGRCDAKTVIVSQRVFRSDEGVGFRFTFCCRRHSPTPWLEVEMTREGALRFASDVVAAAAGAPEKENANG